MRILCKTFWHNNFKKQVAKILYILKNLKRQQTIGPLILKVGQVHIIKRIKIHDKF